jgi:hypothetical protein
MSSDIQVTNALFTKIIKMNAFDKEEINLNITNKEQIDMITKDLEDTNKKIDDQFLLYDGQITTITKDIKDTNDKIDREFLSFDKRIDDITDGKNAITIVTFEAEGNFDSEFPYTWSMGNGSCASANFGFIYPFKGKIIGWAFNCKGANKYEVRNRCRHIEYSSAVFELVIDGYCVQELEFKSDVNYDNYTKTGRSKGTLTNNNDLNFSDINLEFKEYKGPAFDDDARYRVSFYIQATESISV